MDSTTRSVPTGVPTAAGAIGIAVAYGAGMRSWKLAAVALAATGLIGLDITAAWRG
jgi:hypothetical protein